MRLNNIKQELELSVSEFVALLNQTLEFAYPSVTIIGELANLRISKNRWLYFDLKDESSVVKFFGTVYQLPGPLENGLLVKVRGQPKLHNVYGFSINVVSIQPTGEGSIRRAADLLHAKLLSEGLFEESRKRMMPYPPQRIGLITSKQSAAYADFIKVLNARWRGVDVQFVDVQVQGEAAPSQIVAALEQLNTLVSPPEVIVIIRGGGSAEDLAAFNTEIVARAVAVSRVPTLVAIGHEVDLALAELAADKRASTPSNAAELLVPDISTVKDILRSCYEQLEHDAERHIRLTKAFLQEQSSIMEQGLYRLINNARAELKALSQLLMVLNPESILGRGYAIVRSHGQAIRSVKALSVGGIVDVQLSDGQFSSQIDEIKGEDHD